MPLHYRSGWRGYHAAIADTQAAITEAYNNGSLPADNHSGVPAERREADERSRRRRRNGSDPE